MKPLVKVRSRARPRRVARAPVSMAMGCRCLIWSLSPTSTEARPRRRNESAFGQRRCKPNANASWVRNHVLGGARVRKKRPLACQIVPSSPALLARLRKRAGRGTKRDCCWVASSEVEQLGLTILKDVIGAVSVEGECLDGVHEVRPVDRDVRSGLLSQSKVQNEIFQSIELQSLRTKDLIEDLISLMRGKI